MTEQPEQPPEAEETPSSHETAGQFPADEIAATHEESESSETSTDEPNANA